MGFLSMVRKAKRYEKELKILVLGLDNSGKSTVVKSLLEEDVYDVEPTFGFNIKTLTYTLSCEESSDKENLKDKTNVSQEHPQKTITNDYTVHIWDVGGQDSIRPFWRNYYESLDGIVWVVDSSADSRFSECRRLMGTILEPKQDDEDIISSDFILLVLLNKSDLSSSVPRERVVEALDLDRLGRPKKTLVLECSAINRCENIKKGFDWLIARAAERVY